MMNFKLNILLQEYNKARTNLNYTLLKYILNSTPLLVFNSTQSLQIFFILLLKKIPRVGVMFLQKNSF